MIEGQLHRLQKVVVEKTIEIDTLNRVIQELRAQIQRMDNQSDDSESSFMQNQSLAKIKSLEREIKGLTEQRRRYKQTCDQLGQQISQLKEKILGLHTELQISKKENQILKINRAALQIPSATSFINQLQKINTELSTLINEKLKLTQTNEELHNQLLSANEQIQDLTEDLEKQTRDLQEWKRMAQQLQERDISHQIKEQIQVFKATIEGLEKQLNEKEFEMVQLNIAATKNKDAFLEKSLHFLRNNLQSKSQLVKETLRRLHHTEKLMKELEKGLQQTKDMPEKMARLTEQINRRNKQNSQLKQQIRELSQNLRSVEQQNHIFDERMVQLLIENQNYHRMMFSEFGEVHRQRIREERMKLEDQIQRRKKERRWVTIGQLILANRNLMSLIDQRNYH